jgi:hypothetical protein
LRTTAAPGSGLNQAETAHDEPMIGKGPTIRINQRIRLNLSGLARQFAVDAATDST